MSRNTTDPPGAAGDRDSAGSETAAGNEGVPIRTYRCSICGRTVRYAGGLPALYPFCCERCKLIDLGRWFNEEYSIDRDLGPEDIADIREDGSLA